MERQTLISSVLLFLTVLQTIQTTTNTMINYTTVYNQYMSTIPIKDFVMRSEFLERGVHDVTTSTETYNAPIKDESDHLALDALSILHDSVVLDTPFEETLTNSTGVITFTVTSDNYIEKKTWNIHLPSTEDGVVIQFNDLCLTHGHLDIFGITNDSEISNYKKISAPGSREGHRPWLVRESHVKVILVTYHDELNVFANPLAFINLTHSSHPVQTMPRDYITHQYNCSGDIIVPSAVRCNMLRECINNEDEDECDYTHQGCEDWIPFQDQCLKLVFANRLYEPSLQDPQRSPVASQKICATRHGAQLAPLNSLEIVNFLHDLLKLNAARRMIVGIKRVEAVTKTLRHLYRYIWQWGDKGSPIAYRLEELQKQNRYHCTNLVIDSCTTSLEPVPCNYLNSRSDGFICMKSNPSYPKVDTLDTHLSVRLPRPSRQINKFPTKPCSDGSLVHSFLPCHYESYMTTQSSYTFPLFPCYYGSPIHYTLVCDGNHDCPDGSDEKQCKAIQFAPLLDSMFTCENFQLVPKSKLCDGKYDCFDESDEKDCKSCSDDKLIPCGKNGCLPDIYGGIVGGCPSQDYPERSGQLVQNGSSVVSIDGFGMSFLLTANQSNLEGTIQCRNGDYYIPSFLLNNGERDCMSGEDENIPLENMTCPGFYRCRHSSSCVHPDYVCDNIHHCPYKDDERYCDIKCPDGCRCEGYAFSCAHVSNMSDILLTRYLDLSGSVNISLEGIHFLELLTVLNLSHCALDIIRIRRMLNLRSLDISFNRLDNVSSFVFQGLSGLERLDLSGNTFAQVLDTLFSAFIKQSGLTHLRCLVMRHTELHTIKDKAFSPLKQLEHLDIRNNFIDSYDREVFWGLDSLKLLYTDDSKLCCPYFYDSQTLNCIAPFDELSSCSDLLRLNVFRVFLWLVALLAILGNAGVVLYRVFVTKQKTFSAFRILVSNLCGADLIMGVYMTVIGIADARFRGVYVTKENGWKRSVVCKVAGFLGLLSSETSALTICLITLDRVLVLCFPLRSHLHLTARSSVAACAVMWLVAVIMASVPLLADLEFYGVSSICLPLPITRRQFSGQFYSVGVFIIFNFSLFVFIGMGQILTYRAIRSASKAAGTNRRSQEVIIARRLFLVLLSDFCCWFPIGLMGLLAECGTLISDEVNVWTAIFVLPLNSALNPFLYTLNGVLEKWRIERLKKKATRLLANIQIHLPKLAPSTAEEILRICIQSNMVKREKVLQLLQLQQDNTTIDSEPEFNRAN